MAKLAYTLGKQISLAIIKSESLMFCVQEIYSNWIKTTKDELDKLVKVQLKSSRKSTLQTSESSVEE